MRGIHKCIDADGGYFEQFAKYHISSILSLFTIKFFNSVEGTLQYLSFKSLLINIGWKLLELLTDESGPVLSEHPVF